MRPHYPHMQKVRGDSRNPIYLSDPDIYAQIIQAWFSAQDK